MMLVLAIIQLLRKVIQYLQSLYHSKQEENLGGDTMPMVGNKKFPYTKTGKAKAKKEMLKIKKSKTSYGKK